MNTEIVRGLRELANFLEQNPHVPITPYDNDLTYNVIAADDETELLELARIAAMIGVHATERTPGHYVAQRCFAGGVSYTAMSIMSDHMAAFRAVESYRGCVRPEREAS